MSRVWMVGSSASTALSGHEVWLKDLVILSQKEDAESRRCIYNIQIESTTKVVGLATGTSIVTLWSCETCHGQPGARPESGAAQRLGFSNSVILYQLSGRMLNQMIHLDFWILMYTQFVYCRYFIFWYLLMTTCVDEHSSATKDTAQHKLPQSLQRIRAFPNLLWDLRFLAKPPAEGTKRPYPLLLFLHGAGERPLDKTRCQRVQCILIALNGFQLSMVQVEPATCIWQWGGHEDGRDLGKVRMNGPWSASGAQRFFIVAPQCPEDCELWANHGGQWWKRAHL